MVHRPACWFDAHLDLAYLAVNGRDMHAPLDQVDRPHPPAAVTLPSLAAGRVRMALGTIFTRAGGTGPDGYAPGDSERARTVGRAQLEVYLTWLESRAAAIDLRAALRNEPGVGEIRAGMGVAEPAPFPLETKLRRLGAPALHLGLLMEGADPLRTPEDLAWWAERGVVAVGMSWALGTRYAAGNGAPAIDGSRGLTSLGRELAREIDRLGLIHDISHLPDQAVQELFELTDRPVIASHSNCRSLIAPGIAPDRVGDLPRHLGDEVIREIGRRGGVIGLNLYWRLIVRGAAPQRRPTLDEALAHVEHICELTGSTAHVGLGSDMDGGLSAADLPLGIDAPRDLDRLADGLAMRAWDAEAIDAFAWRNWARMISAMPAPGLERRGAG